jgi:hypothetical protein
MRHTEIRQSLSYRIRLRDIKQPGTPEGEPVKPFAGKFRKFLRRKSLVPLLCGLDGFQWRQIVRAYYLKTARDVIEEGVAPLQCFFPEMRFCCFVPVGTLSCSRHAGVVSWPRSGRSMLSIDNLQQAGGERIAEFFNPGSLRRRKRLVGKLSYGPADSNLATAEMVHQAKPVFVVDGRKEPVQKLRIH